MKPLRPLFFASFFFSFHVALLSYMNSTVLASHASALQTTLTYTVSSMLSLVLLILAPRIVRKIGSSMFLIGTLALSGLLLSVLGSALYQNMFLLMFVLYFSLNTVIWYAFDLVIEHYSREQSTGNIRGLYLSLNNVAWVLAPLIASALAYSFGYMSLYSIASIYTLVALFVIWRAPRITIHHHVPHISLSAAFNALVTHPHARRIVVLYFVIQFFFAWMVLYMAPYLLSLGFDWGTIGVIFSIMLLPFALFQYVAGKIADRYHAERTLIIVGFAIAALATLALSFPFPPVALIFAGILFMTRVGASIIEVGCESSFFKQVSEDDTALIGTLRMTLPLAYIIAPLAGVLVLSLGSVRTLYGMLSIFLASAMIYAFRLKN